jgi:hypothetical protein
VTGRHAAAAALVLTACTGSAAAPPSGAARTLQGGPFEPSGAVHLPGLEGVLFVDDGRPGQVLLLAISPSGEQAGAVESIPIGADVPDPEGITTDGEYVYVVGSQSRGRQKGPGLARFRFDPKARKATGVEVLEDLDALLAGVPELRDGSPGEDKGKGKGKKGKGKGKGNTGEAEALNIEGLAWDPLRGRLLLGLRAPLADADAMLVPLKLRDRRAPLRADNVGVEPVMRLSLGGSGIRSIERDAASGTFHVIGGGVVDAGQFRLYTWSGEGAQVKEVRAFSKDLRPEGVARATIGGRAHVVVLGDTGQYLLLD